MTTHILRLPVHLRAIVAGLLLLGAVPTQLEQLGLPPGLAEVVGAVVFLVGFVLDRIVTRLLARDADGNGIADVAEQLGARAGIPPSEVVAWVQQWQARRAQRGSSLSSILLAGFLIASATLMTAGCGGSVIESLRLDPMVQPMYARAEVTHDDGGHIEGAVRVFGIPIVTRADIAPGGDASICWYVEGFRKPLGCIETEEPTE